MAKQTTKNVCFNIPGVVAIGDYLPGVVYEVDAADADRLLSTKGFTLADVGHPTPTEQPQE